MLDKLTHCMVMLAIMSIFAGVNGAAAVEFKCAPTPEDSEGPFYKPDAPMRTSNEQRACFYVKKQCERPLPA